MTLHLVAYEKADVRSSLNYCRKKPRQVALPSFFRWAFSIVRRLIVARDNDPKTGTLSAAWTLLRWLPKPRLSKSADRHRADKVQAAHPRLCHPACKHRKRCCRAKCA